MYKYTKTEFTEASGAGAMNGTLDNTISSEQVIKHLLNREIYYVSF